MTSSGRWTPVRILARIILVASIALRSGDSELLRWQSAQMHGFMSAYNAGADVSADDLMPSLPREMIIRAFRSIPG